MQIFLKTLLGNLVEWAWLIDKDLEIIPPVGENNTIEGYKIQVVYALSVEAQPTVHLPKPLFSTLLVLFRSLQVIIPARQ